MTGKTKQAMIQNGRSADDFRQGQARQHVFHLIMLSDVLTRIEDKNLHMCTNAYDFKKAFLQTLRW